MRDLAREARQRHKRDRAVRREAFLAGRIPEVDGEALAEAVLAKLAPPAPKAGDPAPKGVARSDVLRWVPIGPTVVRADTGRRRNRFTGRVRAVAVHEAGLRAYAASGKGGLWHTADGGATWAAVGGFNERTRILGGFVSAQSCASLLVEFGATPADDLVLLGTGEPPARHGQIFGKQGGVGVLSARGPVGRPDTDQTWEPLSGLDLLEREAVIRLARAPGATPFAVGGATPDILAAASTVGLLIGVRTATGYTWSKPPGLDDLMHTGAWTEHLPANRALPHGAPGSASPYATPIVWDVLWLPGGAQGRLLLAVHGRGVAYTDDRGATCHWLPGVNWPVSHQTVQGRSSLAVVPGTDTAYVLTGLRKPSGSSLVDDTALFRIEHAAPAGGAAPSAAVRVTGVPARLWGSQRDYDQALAVDTVTRGAVTRHRVYLGGSFFDTDDGDDGSVFCFEVDGTTLVAAEGISRTATSAAALNEGSPRSGYVGVGVHADIHSIVIGSSAGAAAGQVWVGCDGGVFISREQGRVFTFVPRNTGMATLECNFAASHPSSSHVVATGVQDNGMEVRIGDTVWDDVVGGDGGGVAIHPLRSHVTVSQTTSGSWWAEPAAGFVGPLTRTAGGGSASGREDDRAFFYSGIAATVMPAQAGPPAVPARARIAIGTNRVWLSDDFTGTGSNTWRALPWPSGAASDARPHGSDASPQFGVPRDHGLGPLVTVNGTTIGPLGSVVTMRWASPTELLVVFGKGVVRWTQTGGTWQATVLVNAVADPWRNLADRLSDIMPVPGTQSFYLSTVGHADRDDVDTLYFHDGALHATGLRRVLAPDPAHAGPRDPAFALALDTSTAPEAIYVGTMSGIWRGTRAAGGNVVTWPSPAAPMVNGLPQALVQDLTLTSYTTGGHTRRMLRAAVQARGIWEVDLGAPSEPQRTYLRVHQYDDRRGLPTDLADPRTPPPVGQPAAPNLDPFNSPDIVVRPRQPAAAPPFLGLNLGVTTTPSFELWTFQTAFRWRYPSVVANGLWSLPFEGLVRRERARLGMATPPGHPVIDALLWQRVVGGTRISGTGEVRDPAPPGDALAVYRSPWHVRGQMDLAATEVDLLDGVVPVSLNGGRWNAFAEESQVDVLLHHRDTRPVQDAHALVLWRKAATEQALTALTVQDAVTAVIAAATSGHVVALPGGWQVAGPAVGAAVATLGVPLEARLPRALSFDVDLQTGPGAFALFLAVAWSGADPLTPPVPALTPTTTVADLVTTWPHAAARIVRLIPRPAPPGP